MINQKEEEVNRYVAIDLHRRNFVTRIYNKETKKMKIERYTNTKETIKEFANTLDKRCNVVIEATQGAALMYDILKEVVNKVVVANPKRLKVIFDSYKKTDENDTMNLIELLIADKVPEVYIAPKEYREMWKLIKVRELLSKTKTGLKNTIHGIIGGAGNIPPCTDLFGKKGKEYLLGLKLGEVQEWIIKEILPQIEEIEEKMKRIEEKIASWAINKPQIHLLMTICGLNIYSATAIYVKIGDIGRFRKSDKLSAYFGIVTSTSSSDKKTRHGKITKRGETIIRKILLNVIPHVIEGSKEMKEFYTRILKRRGKNIAKVAAVRKLVTIIYAMLTKGKTFREVKIESIERKIKEFVRVGVKGMEKRGTGQQEIKNQKDGIEKYKKEEVRKILRFLLNKEEEENKQLEQNKILTKEIAS